MTAAIISAIAAILSAALVVLFNKQKERDAEWRSKKLAYYEEFITASSGIVGDVAVPIAKIRFANAVNNLHLVASQLVAHECMFTELGGHDDDLSVDQLRPRIAECARLGKANEILDAQPILADGGAREASCHLK